MLTEAWPGTSVLYICPIKALLNNLEHRLTHYAGLVGRRVEVWHGDISQSRKNRALRDAPDILLTTPESIEAMLISVRVDRPTWFGNLRAVIVDQVIVVQPDALGPAQRHHVAAGQEPDRLRHLEAFVLFGIRGEFGGGRAFEWPRG